MTRDALLLSILAVVCVALIALAIGWFTPVATPKTTNVRVSAVAVFVHPGAVTGEAARRFGAAEVVAEMPELEAPDTSIDVSSTKRAPPSSTVDIVTRFRSELIAVIVEGGRSVVLLKTGETAPRRASAGEAYRDGWRLQEIAADAVVIERRREERRIAVMGDHSGAIGAGLTENGESPRQRRVLTRQDARTRRS